MCTNIFVFEFITDIQLLICQPPPTPQLWKQINVFNEATQFCSHYFSAPYDLQPPEGTDAAFLTGRVPLFPQLRFLVNDGEMNYKGEAGFLPHLTVLY